MSSTDVVAFVAALPKVELHVHLVGSADPETVLTLARRHPDGGVPTEPEALKQFYEFTSFAHFLNVYSQVNLLVRTGADVVTLLDGLGRQLSASHTRYAEVQVTCVRNRMAGITPDDLAQALADGHALAQERYNVELAWIFDADATLGPAGAQETLAFAVGYRPPGTVGLGLAGPESGINRADYAAVFHDARDAGLHSIPHAGETAGPQEVWAAIRDLGAERIGHGISAATDPTLMDYLAAHQVTLDVCPTSNVCTSAVPGLSQHPLPTLLAAGVPVTINTDDPGMFHTDLNREYLLCHTEFGLDSHALAGLARTATRAAFCSGQTRDAILAEIDQLTASITGGRP